MAKTRLTFTVIRSGGDSEALSALFNTKPGKEKNILKLHCHGPSLRNITVKINVIAYASGAGVTRWPGARARL